MTDVFERLEKISGVATRKDELMSLHTSLGVGGPCDLMVWVSNESALQETVALAKRHSLPLIVLGNASNVLVRDGGINGLVVRLVEDFAKAGVSGHQIRAGAGAHLPEVVSLATSSGIAGLDFLAGIPGTIGGAVATNAGGKDVWISHRLSRVKVLTAELRPLWLETRNLDFSYRQSGIDPQWVVMEAVLVGYQGRVEDIRQKVEENLARRRATQPEGERTAGCIFRNPPGDSAGRLIDKAGFKGLHRGGAQVSTVHANFIVNRGGATAKEILDLIEEVKDGLREAYGLDLHLEISVVGRD